MSAPSDYYEEGEADEYAEQCTGCDKYIDPDSSDGFCAECREARVEEDPEDEEPDEFADTQVLLSCPQCHALIGYNEVEVSIHSDTFAQCPQCGGDSPTADWFA